MLVKCIYILFVYQLVSELFKNIKNDNIFDASHDRNKVCNKHTSQN